MIFATAIILVLLITLPFAYYSVRIGLWINANKVLSEEHKNEQFADYRDLWISLVSAYL